MNKALERQVLDLVRERGLIAEGDIDASAAAGEVVRRWGNQLGVLVVTGALAETDLVGLVGELTGGLSGAEPPDDARDEDDDVGGVSNEDRTNIFWHTDDGEGSSATLDVSGRWQSSAGSLNDSPVPDWERYEIVGFLGAGGMGRVYKAWDPRLQRHVALKFLSRNDPDVVQRFFREAQSQAQVEHPHVCRIYEVGEVDEQPYIAMQYVEGRPSNEVRDEMTVDERVVALARIADAVHAAHRTGLIHRDIKPTNIIFGRADDGGWTPTILDFGLARQMEGEGLTVTGALMGTPSYMAPEQARGETDRLDRRTDVYGLGATMYLLLSGQPPYDGENQLEVLLKAAEGEPRPLSELDPTLPADLCNITTRAMEREPQRRYESARALAEDLGRYLDGEPVQARPQSVGYKLGKWARRNRRLVAVGGAALVAVLVVLGLLVHQRYTAAEQQRMAQRFSQEAAQIESIMWKSRAVPAHDTRIQKELVRAQMEQIEADMEQLGRNAQGPGHYALGAAHQALFEPDDSRDHLQQAWDAGFQTPEVAYGMALALGDIYQRERTLVEGLYAKRERAAKLAEVTVAYRDPAVEWLRYTKESEHVAPDYALALIAFHEERFDDALSHGARALEGRPWLYEAWIIQGLVHSRRGLQQSLDGDKEGALRSFELGERAYLEAERIAPSDVRILEGVARLYMRRYTHRLLGEQGQQEDRERLLAVIDRGVMIDEERATLQAARCYAYEIVARWRYGAGEDTRAAMAQAILAGERAVELAPQDVYARAELGSAYSYQAWLAVHNGEDAMTPLRRAIEVLEGAIEIRPAYSLLIELAVAYESVARHEISHGQDAMPALEQAEAHVRRAVELRPEASHPSLVLGEVLQLTGYVLQERGEDPTVPYSRALEAVEIRKENDPFEGWLLVQSAYVRLDLAKYQMATGRDPRETLATVLEAQARSVLVRPGSAAPLELLGDALIVRADHEATHGVDPGATLDEAQAAFDRALEMRPGVFSVRFKGGYSALVAAQYAWRSGGDPGPNLARALASFDDAIEGSPGLAELRPYPAAAHALRARDALDRGRSPVSALDAGTVAIDRVLAPNPIRPETLRVRADLELSRARWAMASGGDPAAAFSSAEESLSKALSTNPRDAASYLQRAESEYWRATWLVKLDGDPGDPLARGLEWVDRALEIKPDFADALALRGRLQLMAARATTDPTAATRAAGLARDALEASLAIDANLEWRLRGDLAEARRLAR